MRGRSAKVVAFGLWISPYQPLEFSCFVRIVFQGIGRPADKRASHALPHRTLGAAREAEWLHRHS